MGDSAVIVQFEPEQIQAGHPGQDVAPYSFAKVDAELLPAGEHVPIGTFDGVQIYVADPCLDVSAMRSTDDNVFSVHSVRVVDGQANSVIGIDSPRTLDAELPFDALEFGDFLGAQRESIDQATDGQQPNLCHEASATMDPLYPQVGGTVPGMSVKV